MLSDDHNETNPSTAAVSAPLAACSMIAVQQQKTECRQTKMHPKAKLQNAPTFTWNGSHI